jgi:excinuclease UvrABC nuclease subunit
MEGPFAFDQATIDTRRNDGFCVYCLCYSTNVAAYVGKSKTLRDRLTFWFNNPPGSGLTQFYAEAFQTEAAMNAREEQLIKELQPALNTLLK